MSEFNEEFLTKVEYIDIQEHEFEGMKIDQITPFLRQRLIAEKHLNTPISALSEAILEFSWYYEDLTLRIKYSRLETEDERAQRRKNWERLNKIKVNKKKTQQEKDEYEFERLRKKLGK